ncbi:MAG: copper chaperone PCu(A)C [Methylocystis sp.]|nr:copper chaperone PCu(A)C [Methylocystis sp.]
MSINRRNVLQTGGCLLASGAVGFLSSLKLAFAHEYEIGKLKVEHPWLRYPKEGETTAPLYMLIHNNGDTADKLIGVKSEKVGKIVLHADPRYIVVPHGIVVPPKSMVTLAPDGPYVSLMNIKKMNPVGWGFEVVLVFEKAGEATIDAAVDAPDAAHAHDAEAMERWEKAHPSESGAAPSGHEMHHDHGQMDHGAMDHGAAAVGDNSSNQPK